MFDSWITVDLARRPDVKIGVDIFLMLIDLNNGLKIVRA